MTSSDLGFVFRGDITRIGGTYWNLERLLARTIHSALRRQSTDAAEPDQSHLSPEHDVRQSQLRLVAGFGRLICPGRRAWTLSTAAISERDSRRRRPGDFRRIYSRSIFVGLQSGSGNWRWHSSTSRAEITTPFHYSSTSGAGVSLVSWQIDRPFIFFENSVSYSAGILGL